MKEFRRCHRHILFLLACLTIIQVSHSAALSAPGDLDLSFGQSGMAFFDYPNSSFDMVNAVAVQTDGKILAAGQTDPLEALLVRFLPDGSLDPSFGNGGVLAQFGLNLGPIKAVTVQPDGKLLVAGEMPIAEFVYVCRRHSDGSPDWSFGGFLGAGCRVFKWEDSSTSGHLSAIAVQSDAKILVAGSSWNADPPFSDFGIARFKANGTFDTTFSGDGRLVTGFLSVQNTGKSFCQAVAVSQATGKIALAGYMVGLSGDENFAIKLVNPDGSLDTSFNQSIFVPGRITDFVGHDDRAYGVVFQGSKIIAGGSAEFVNDYEDFALAKYNGNGTLDTSFGFGGRLVTSFSDLTDIATALALQTDGKIVVAGTALNPNSGHMDFALARYGPTGLLDSTFGPGGKVFTNYDNLGKSAYAMAFQPDGKIIVAGLTYNEFFTDYQFALARYLP